MMSRLFPSHLPKRIKAYRDKYEHHLMLKMAGKGIVKTLGFCLLESVRMFAYDGTPSRSDARPFYRRRQNK